MLYFLCKRIRYGVKSLKYKNRQHAGEVLARKLSDIDFETQPVVLAIPNGGIPVGVEIAKRINADFDAIIVRKMQIPGNPEAGFGSITSYGSVEFNEALLRRLNLGQDQIEAVIESTRSQIESRKEEYEGLVGVIKPEGRDTIIVDDGIASGYTMLAAIHSIQPIAPRSLIVAAPTASARAASLVREKADELVCPNIESGFVFAVANAYEKWYDVPDSEAKTLLKEFR